MTVGSEVLREALVNFDVTPKGQFHRAVKNADQKEKVGRQDSNNQRIDAFIFVSNQFLVSLYCTLVSDILTAEMIKLKLFVGHYNQISLK